MLSPDDFRRIALGMADAIESAHMGHPDFRVNGRIFATLHHDHLWGMVKLTPDQQKRFVRENRATFVPENGAWGRQGCTAVRLNSVDEDTLGEAMTLAWQNTAKDVIVARLKPSTTGPGKKRVAGPSKPRRSTGPVRPSRNRACLADHRAREGWLLRAHTGHDAGQGEGHDGSRLLFSRLPPVEGLDVGG